MSWISRHLDLWMASARHGAAVARASTESYTSALAGALMNLVRPVADDAHVVAAALGGVWSEAAVSTWTGASPVQHCRWCGGCTVPDLPHIFWNCSDFVRVRDSNVPVPSDGVQARLGWGGWA